MEDFRSPFSIIFFSFANNISSFCKKIVGKETKEKKIKCHPVKKQRSFVSQSTEGMIYRWQVKRVLHGFLLSDFHFNIKLDFSFKIISSKLIKKVKLVIL